MKRLEIWGDMIPGNSSRKKSLDMDIGKNPFYLLQMFRMLAALNGSNYKKCKKELDTFTYLAGIKKGITKETYEDVPTLTYYPAQGAKQAVIVVPGGAYAYQCVEMEGTNVANALNKQGIAAFVLDYRLNPYRMPIPLMDMQRAVRYVRAHSEEFGIDEKKISLLGFSAGGYQVGGFANLLQGKNKFPAGYEMDEIDKVDDSVDTVSLLYPCLTWRYNLPILYILFPEETVQNEKTKNQLLKEYDCIENLNSAGVRQFVCYGKKDHVVNHEQSRMYVETLRKANGDVTLMELEGADHGFGVSKDMNRKTDRWFQSYVKWLKSDNTGKSVW